MGGGGVGEEERGLEGSLCPCRRDDRALQRPSVLFAAHCGGEPGGSGAAAAPWEQPHAALRQSSPLSQHRHTSRQAATGGVSPPAARTALGTPLRSGSSDSSSAGGPTQRLRVPPGVGCRLTGKPTRTARKGTETRQRTRKPGATVRAARVGAGGREEGRASSERLHRTKAARDRTPQRRRPQASRTRRTVDVGSRLHPFSKQNRRRRHSDRYDHIGPDHRLPGRAADPHRAAHGARQPQRVLLGATPQPDLRGKDTHQPGRTPC